jgi:trimeric autotransporter adhesin
MKIVKDKRIYTALLVLSTLIIATIVIHGCGVISYEGKKVTSVSIDPVNNTAVGGAVTIAAQTVQQFKVTGHYSDSTTSDVSSESTWSTSDPSVATVSATGLATAVASSGTCMITVTSQGMTASLQLTITNLPIQTITVSPDTVTLNRGFTGQFTATGLFSNGSSTISQDITDLATWSSTTTSVATIDAHGVATAVSSGTTAIAAQWSGKTSNTATLTVSNLALMSIELSITGSPNDCGNTAQMTAIGTFEDNSTQDMTSQVVWSSENPANATVDSSGLVSAVAAGHATITATAGGITGSIQITVYHCGH